MNLFDHTPDPAPTPRARGKKRAPVPGKEHGESRDKYNQRRVCPDPACKLRSHPDLIAERHEVTEKYRKAPARYVTVPCTCDQWSFPHVHGKR